MCGGCNTSSSTTAANPAAQSAYTDVVGKAQQVAATPYQAYPGELVAGMGQAQNTSVDRLIGSYGAAQPYIQQGSGYLSQAGQGLGNVQQYLQAGSDATAGVASDQSAARNQFGLGNSLLGSATTGLGRVSAY